MPTRVDPSKPGLRQRLAPALSALTLIATLTAAGPSASGADASAEPTATHVPFEHYRLQNGLQVILHRDNSLPMVAVNLWYRAGPVNEPAGRSGFAHLFEHLMFEGSKHAGRKFDTLLESIGVTNSNATTSWDRTNYFETVPSQHLELALWLESDRMGFMIDALTKERFYTQREVVKNERRQSYENAPYGPSELALYDALYPPGHPYHGAVIGSMQDLDRATLDDVRDFFERYYVPSNATLTLAGDIEPKAAKQLIEKYFGSLPTAAAPMLTPAPLEARAKEVVLRVEEPVNLARLAQSWSVPPAYSSSAHALDLATTILATGKSSRLYQELVVKEKSAVSVSAYIDANQLVSEVRIEAMVSPGHTAEEVQASIDRVLAELAREGPTEAELERAKRYAKVSQLSSLQRLNGHGGEGGRAGVLQRLNHYLGDPGALPRVMADLDAVTGGNLTHALTRHLRAEQRVVVITVPKPSSP